MGHCWRSKDELLWKYGCTSVGLLAKTYIYQLCAETGCNLHDLPGVMDDKDGWQKRESKNSILSAQLDDDDIYIDIYTYTHRDIYMTATSRQMINVFTTKITTHICSLITNWLLSPAANLQVLREIWKTWLRFNIGLIGSTCRQSIFMNLHVSFSFRNWFDYNHKQS